MSGTCEVERTFNGQAEADAPERIVVEPLLHIFALQGLLEVGGGKLENAVSRPAWEQAEDISHVGIGLDGVELGAGDQRDKSGGAVPSLVASDKQPISAPDHQLPESALTVVV
jgi:hypothetical protein